MHTCISILECNTNECVAFIVSNSLKLSKSLHAERMNVLITLRKISWHKTLFKICVHSLRKSQFVEFLVRAMQKVNKHTVQVHR